MHRMDRKKPDAKEFIKILSPVMSWAMNCKSPLYESVTFKMQNNLLSGDFEFEIQFFFKEEHSNFEYNNTFFKVYQFNRTEDILNIKSNIKDILKVKNADEFIRISNVIKSI